jgi:predicted lipoprotein with Yx(FWY)xxD motif
MRIPWAERAPSSWKLALVPLAAAVLAVACGHSPRATAPTILALQPVNATVSGTPEIILEGDSDRSLYYSSSDSATTVTCRSLCAETWIPFLKPEAPLIGPSDQNGVGGRLTWAWVADECQAEYNGHPLYTYTGDLRPDEASGNDLQGTWFVVTPNVAPAAGWVARRAQSSC